MAENDREYNDMVTQTRLKGTGAFMGSVPEIVDSDEERYGWYRSSEMIPGTYPFMVHLLNKKWPLKKVC